MHAPKWSAPSTSPGRRPAPMSSPTRCSTRPAKPRPNRTPDSRLSGLAFTSKDLFDIEGQPTPAGSVVLSHAPAAKADALGRGPAARRGRRADRPHQHDRIRLLGRRRQPAPRHPRQRERCRHAAHSRRIVIRRRDFGRQRRGLHRPGLRHWRLDPHSGGAERHRRLQEHGPADSRRRRTAAVDHARHGLRHDPLGARRHHRPRNPGRTTRDRRQRPARRLQAGGGEERLSSTASSRAWPPPSSAR
jgi:hypothetical protein